MISSVGIITRMRRKTYENIVAAAVYERGAASSQKVSGRWMPK